jgi:crotonobetaine/carnitine-CoA ligase
VLALWAQGWLGAIGVPVNPALQGNTLRHVLNDSGATVLVTEAAKLPRLAELGDSAGALRQVVLVDPVADGQDADEQSAAAMPGRTMHDWGDLADAAPVPPAAIRFADPYMIMYTSGTTGPSKGVVISHHYYYCYGAPLVDRLGWTVDSHLYTPLPLYHAGAQNAVVLPALLAGARVTVRERFSASSFWTDICDVGATHTHVIGAIARILERQPVQDAETRHRLETFWCGPPPADVERFAERFRVAVLWQGFGMTESFSNQMVPARLHAPGKAANCIGRPTELYEAEVVDELDVPVPADGASVGELVVRAKLPFAMMSGYWGRPDVTAEKFRNLWFHTGDLVTRDAEGYFFLWGRTSDAIRSRGENVSAFEIEQECLQHADVEQAAAFGVPGDLGDEDVKVDVVLSPGTTTSAADLATYLRERLAPFMMPRYIQVRAELPTTATQKIEKYRLRAEGVGGAQYDGGSSGRRSGRA